MAETMFDALVVGSGIAGLRAAIEVAAAGRVAVLTKDGPTAAGRPCRVAWWVSDLREFVPLACRDMASASGPVAA